MIKLIPIIVSIFFAIVLQAHASDHPNQIEPAEPQQATLKKPFYEEPCDAKDSSCISVVVKFLKAEATKSTKRLHTIYRAYEKVLPASERSDLKVEQNNWSKTDISKCNSINDVIDRWSCIEWATSLRSVELDRRLGDKFKDSINKLQPVALPINLRKDHLGVFAGTPVLYALNFDQFELSQDTDGNYEFSVEVVGGNGHSCSVGGNARREGNLFTRVPEETSEKILARTAVESLETADLFNRSCKLEIKLFPNHIEFEGNRECVEYFSCGTSPDGTFFLDSTGNLAK